MDTPATLRLLLVGPGIVAAVWTDMRSRRIPNRLTYPMIVGGILWNAFAPGALGAADSGLGFAAGFGAMLAGFLLGGVGGGDVKLMGAIGAWLGLVPVLHVTFYALCFAVAAAILLLALRGTLWETLKAAIYGMLVPGFSRRGSARDQAPRTALLPFAVMIAAAVAFHFVDLHASWRLLG